MDFNMNPKLSKESKTMKMRSFAFGLSIFLTFVLLTTICQEIYAQDGTYNVGDVVNDFTIQDMDGNPVSLYDSYEGYAILINFFAYG